MTTELLSPAGDFEKLRAAIRYGADAVYLAGEAFGMRAASANFTNEELAEAVAYAHQRGVKIYITVNILPRTKEYESLRPYLIFLESIGVDAVIVSDLGVFTLVREVAPKLAIHISTQASSVSAQACTAWYKMGASRVVLARELSMAEIKEIRENTPPDLELEAFVHGAMCIAYSGRCLLSNYFTGRDGNHGMCAQPCRWNYNELVITEEKRPDDRVHVIEDHGDTFVMSSRDTCMIEHVPELIDAGITSFKIEGRVKSAYYTAVVTNTYRMAMDAYTRDPANYRFDPAWMRELDSVSHREYATGFYLDDPMKESQLVQGGHYIGEKAYYGTALETDSPEAQAELQAILDMKVAYETPDGRLYRFMEKNKVRAADPAEIISPGKTGKFFYVGELYDTQGRIRANIPHPQMIFWARIPFEVTPGDIMRVGTKRDV